MTPPRRRVGLVSNPLSRAGRDARARLGAPAADLPRAEPASRAELLDALRDFAARGVDLLAVQGGDGTLREVLTALPGAFGDRSPEIAVLAAGKTNLAARVLGSAGMGEAALNRLLDAAGRGALRRRVLPVLNVSRPGVDAEDAPPLRGVLFGAAAFTEGKLLADKRLHRRGVYDGAAVALALAAVALRAGLDRGHALRAGVPMAVAPDDRPKREGRRFLLLATTLDRLMLGLRPFWGEGRCALGRRARAAAALDACGRLSQRPGGAAADRPGRPLRAGRRAVRAGAARPAAFRARPGGVRFAMTAPAPRDPLEALAAAELAVPPEPNPAVEAARALAREIAARHGDGVAAVLFYGACRRDGDASGLLDLYVLTTGHRAFHGRAVPALLNAALPPTVLLWRGGAPQATIRAKVAVLSLGQFERRVCPRSLDTTLWARFCQPSTLVHARDEAARRRVERAVAEAVAAAALWALRLGPEEATPAEYWRGLFARTYAAELRAERGDRPARLLAAAPEWYGRALPLALARLGLPAAATGDGRLRPGLPRRRRWALAWALRRVCGKALNALRLAKAAFTFEGGADYLAWKIERHSGVSLELADWHRRHPLLAAPALLWRLRRRGAAR